MNMNWLTITECDKMTSWSVSCLVSLLTLLDLLDLSLGGCMFQEPFYFTSAPKINAILDRRGRPIADKWELFFHWIVSMFLWWQSETELGGNAQLQMCGLFSSSMVRSKKASLRKLSYHPTQVWSFQQRRDLHEYWTDQQTHKKFWHWCQAV